MRDSAGGRPRVAAAKPESASAAAEVRIEREAVGTARDGETYRAGERVDK
jgi:hypothetical protein